MEAFIAGADLRDLPSLNKLRMKLRLVRTNELSVERLHRLGTLEGSHATNYSEVYVSYQLRIPDVLSGPHAFGIDELAEVAEELRHMKNLLDAFSLHKHPAVLEEQRAIQERTGVERSLAISHRTIRAVLYRSDPVSMFCGQTNLKAAITEHRKRLKESEDMATTNPLNDAAKPDASAQVKLDALRCRYALKHFKECFVSYVYINF